MDAPVSGGRYIPVHVMPPIYMYNKSLALCMIICTELSIKMKEKWS